MVKIGLLGCGRWGRFILRDLKQWGAHVTVLAVGERSRMNAQEGQANAVVTRLEDMPAVDGYVVAVPTALLGLAGLVHLMRHRGHEAAALPAGSARTSSRRTPREALPDAFALATAATVATTG